MREGWRGMMLRVLEVDVRSANLSEVITGVVIGWRSDGAPTVRAGNWVSLPLRNGSCCRVKNS